MVGRMLAHTDTEQNTVMAISTHRKRTQLKWH